MPSVSKQSCAAEFIGTFFLVFVVGCNVLNQQTTFGGVSIACTLMVSIYAFGAASGANFNPAVSFALGLAGKHDEGWKQVGVYSGMQLLGATVAAILYFMLFDDGFAVQPKANHVFGALLCEVLYTFMLCFVVLNVATSKKASKNEYYGLAIGFVVLAGAYGAGPLGAGCFNPAVAFGIAVSSFGLSIHWCLVYILAEIVGAAMAVGLFWVIRPEEKDDSKLNEEYTLVSKLLAEAVGTFMLVFTVGLNVLGDSPAAAFSIAASLTCMIYALGDVSGAHFNPAVTTAIFLQSGRAFPDFGPYVAAQLGGGLLAAFSYAAAHNFYTFELGPSYGWSWTSVLFVEFVFTFVLTGVVLCVACQENEENKKAMPKEMIGLIVGSCVTAGGFAAGPISGGSLNPAVSCGIAAADIISGGFFFQALLYTAAELLGGAAAAGVFKAVYAPPSDATVPADEEAGKQK